MQTKWFKNLLECYNPIQAFVDDSAYRGTKQIKDINGTLQTPNVSPFGIGFSFTGLRGAPDGWSGGANYNNIIYWFMIGSGTATPTVDDFRLQSVISSGFTATTLSQQTTVDTNGISHNKIVIHITNTNTLDNLDINEIGLFCSPGGYFRKNILIERDLVSPGITIAPLDSANISIDLSLNL